MNLPMQELREKLESLVPKWIKRMDLDWWRIECHYIDTYDNEADGTYATTHALWQYREGTIKFFLPAMLRLTDEQVEQTVVHELCHLLLDPMTPEDTGTDKSDKQADKLVEFTTEAVARAILKTRGKQRG